MGLEVVPFPHDSPNWALVRDLLTELQERLLNETINAQDAAMHIQVIYEACQATQHLDERWVQREYLSGNRSGQGARQKLDQSYLWYGMLKFLKKVGDEEREKFLFTTLPNIIELALRVEEHMPPSRLTFSQQQRGGSTVLSRQFIASILACSFLCLFPERIRDRTSKLNIINFTNFFKQLPQSSQMAKLRCFLHYFERTMEAGLERQGSIVFHRQVADRDQLPSLEDLAESDVVLCPFEVCPEGLLESMGSTAIQVDFANRSIGGGVLGRGRVQEEIRFSTCPELVAAMLFMENMEENEAIVIVGFEQFAACTGYAASLEFAGPFFDTAQRDAAGNLLNTLCAIDATSFRWGGTQRQYQEAFVMREVHKALVGFRQVRQKSRLDYGPVTRGTSSEWEEDFVTASESLDEDRTEGPHSRVQQMGEVLSKSILSQGLVEATRMLTYGGARGRSLLAMEEMERLQLDNVSLHSASSDGAAAGQSSSTPRDETAQVPRDEAVPVLSHGGNGERLSLPLAVPRPQNGSYDLLEVDYSEWLANFRRRSSQLSDLTSRRSSSSTKQSSEFSSDLEEIYETLVQAEKTQHGIIEEESYGAALSEYAAHFVTSLVSEGTSTAAQMLPGMKEFQQGSPPAGTLRPQVVRPFAGALDNEVASSLAPGEGDFVVDEEVEEDLSDTLSHSRPPQAKGLSSLALSYVEDWVSRGMKSGMAEAAQIISMQSSSHNQEHHFSHIPDDVYRWFADKIVQEVFAHVVDELYFQRFTSDSRWRADLPINREGVQQRTDQSDSDSVSSSSSSSDALRGFCDLQSGSNALSSREMLGRAAHYWDRPDLQRSRSGSNDSAGSGVYPATQDRKYPPSIQLSSRKESAEPISAKRKIRTRRINSQSSDSESTEAKGKEERKSVTFTVSGEKGQAEGRGRGVPEGVSSAGRTSRTSAAHSVSASSTSSESRSSYCFVVRDIPVPFTKGTTRMQGGFRSTKEVSSSKPAEASDSRSAWSGSDLSGASVQRGVATSRDSATSRKDECRPAPSSSSSSFISTATSSIPTSSSAVAGCTSLPSPAYSAPTHSSPASCDKTDRPAEPKNLPATSLPLRDSTPGAAPLHSSLSRLSMSESDTSSVPSSSSAFQLTSTTGGVVGAVSGGGPDSRTTSEQGASSSLSAQDLNLDCYRTAAAIVNQVFQSLPDYLSEAELQSLSETHSSFYYHGRKYESIFPRGSYETAAAIIGASEKGNVVSENYMQSRMTSGGPSSETTSPRRTRSQSPCFSWLSKRLSRETLTNAFVKVESRHSVKSYERRSSEPCQRSVTLSLQAFNTGRNGYGSDRGEEKLRKNACTDDDLDKVKANSWRRGSFDSISLSRRRSSFGFKDPVLSRFAQELISADTSVPQLFFGSRSTSSTTGSRRSSMSGFRDTTLATFESELLNSSFSMSQAPPSPHGKRPQRSHSRESRLWKSDSSETEYWFPIPRRVGQEFQDFQAQLEQNFQQDGMDDIESYADFVARTVMQQAVGILCPDIEDMFEDEGIAIFSINLADQVIREGLLESAQVLARARRSRRRGGKHKSASDSEMDFSVSSNDLTARSLEDRLTDFQDALDVSYNSVEMYAGRLAEGIMSAALHDFGAMLKEWSPCGLPIATGNWGCGAFCGDPCLKMALQWVAASLAHSPRLFYFTFGDPRLVQLEAVVQMLSDQRWTVGQLMRAVRAYCSLVLSDLDSCAHAAPDDDADDAGGGARGGGVGGGKGRERERFVPAQTLFDFLLSQP